MSPFTRRITTKFGMRFFKQRSPDIVILPGSGRSTVELSSTSCRGKGQNILLLTRSVFFFSFRPVKAKDENFPLDMKNNNKRFGCCCSNCCNLGSYIINEDKKSAFCRR